MSCMSLDCHESDLCEFEYLIFQFGRFLNLVGTVSRLVKTFCIVYCHVMTVAITVLRKQLFN